MVLPYPTRSAWPRMPCGRTSRIDDQDDKRADGLELRRDPQRRQLDDDADHEAADQRAVGGAEAAQRHAGEHQQQQLEAHLPAHLLGQAVEDAAERRQARRPRPTRR